MIIGQYTDFHTGPAFIRTDKNKAQFQKMKYDKQKK